MADPDSAQLAQERAWADKVGLDLEDWLRLSPAEREAVRKAIQQRETRQQLRLLEGRQQLRLLEGRQRRAMRDGRGSGPLPYGYATGTGAADVGIDDAAARVVELIFASAEGGKTPCATSRASWTYGGFGPRAAASGK